MDEITIARDMNAKRKARELARRKLITLKNFSKLEGSDYSEIGTEWFAYDTRNDRIAVTLLRPLNPEKQSTDDDRSIRFDVDGKMYILTFFGKLPIKSLGGDNARLENR